MPEIQINSQNYNGKTVDVIFYSINNPEVGVSLGTYTVPFVYSSEDCFGTYELYPSEYEGKMCQVVMNPTPTPTPTVTPTTTPNLITRDSYYYDNTLLMHFDNRTGSYDPYSDNVSLLMYMSGSNGSTAFIDSSLSSLTLTPYGNAQISTSQSKFGGSSASFDGNGDYISIPTGSHTNFETGDFTIECWFRSNNLTGNCGIFGWQANQSGSDPIVRLGVFDGVVNFAYRGGAYTTAADLNSQSSINVDQWHHVAVSRNSNVMRLYLDGVLQEEHTPSSPATLNAPFSANIGAIPFDGSAQWFFNGYVDDLRVTKGIGRYTSNFTPSSTTLPAIIPLFKDSSAYDNRLIASSATISSDDSKFGGYSGYFNGSSFVRSAGTDIWQLGTDDFTIESWINPSSISNRRSIVGNYDGSNGGWALSIKQPSGGTPTYGPEVSFAATSNGSEVDVIIPGVLEITRNNYQQIYNSAVESYADYTVSPANTSWNCEGWTNICNYGSRSFYYYRTSLNNIGLNPRLSVNVEMLMKHNPTNRIWLVKFSEMQAGGGGAFAYTRKELLSCAVDSSIIQFRNGNGSVIEKTTSSVIPTETWSHIAAVRSSGVLKLFLDGTQIGSDSSFTDNITINNSYGLTVGATILSNGTTSDYFSGYLDDIRITKGTARYTSNFNVPTKAFADFGPVSTAPSAPINLSVLENQNVVSLFWDKPLYPKLIDNRAPITNYVIEHSNDDGLNWTQADTLEYLIVAGGGGGGAGWQGGGGGGGGVLSGSTIFNSTFNITVGSGGTGGNQGTAPSNGQNSILGSIVALGGGKGANEQNCCITPTGASTGGSGGGGAHGNSSGVGGALGTSGQGFAGGNGYSNSDGYSGGGGGGAGGAGLNSTNNTGGNGGNGMVSSIAGLEIYYGGGGGGSVRSGTQGIGGVGGGGNAGGTGVSGVSNTGGGGGAATGGGGGGPAGNGGSGIVVIAYPNSYPELTIDNTLTYQSLSSRSGYRVYKFTAGSGNVSINIQSLTAGTPYKFRVKAQNSVGFGDYSNTAQIIVPQTSPTILSVIPDDSQAYVSWDAPLIDAYYSNVSLLLKADSTIVDLSSSPKTVSALNVPVSSTQSKFGGNSLYLSPSNTSSYLSFSQSNDFNFSTGDFTVEFWIYPLSAGGAIRRWVNNEAANGITIRDNNGTIHVYTLDSSSNYSQMYTGSQVLVNQWQHIAVVRYNGTVFAYKNGIYIGSMGVSYPINMNGFILGSSGGEMPDCYIDDFRITKGVARYTSATSNFTAPTTEFLPFGANNSSTRDYAIAYSSDGGINWSNFSHSPSTNTLINVTGLNNGSDYIFKVAAVNFAGTGVYSSPSSSITVGPRTDNLYNKTRLLLHLDSN